MRLVPVLFPSDLGHNHRGEYAPGGERGAPDVLLDLLEDEGLRFSRPVSVPVPAAEAAPEDAALKFDAPLAEATQRLAEVVAEINAAADFPLVLGGDHSALCGHALGHSARHRQGIGVAVLADAFSDLARPAPPVFEDKKRLRTDPAVTRDGGLSRMALAATLGELPADTALGALMQGSAAQAKQTSVVGVRAPTWAQVKEAEARLGVDVWRMERLELDGESTYRSALTRHLSYGPILLSIDVGGLDPDLMPAVREPVSDGLDWSFLKRSLEQCVPHKDRILGLDICELDPGREDAHQRGLVRFAETLAPFLRRLARS